MRWFAMRAALACAGSALLVLIVGHVPSVLRADQTPTAKSLEDWIRRGYTLESAESQAVWIQLGWSGVGYGFRTFAARQPAATERAVQEIQGLGTAMEYYRIKLDELHTTMDGDIGLAWGVHTEDFKMKGQPAEVIRVRFTNTLRWTGSAWKNLLYHRDAQPFGPDARYIRIPAPPAKPSSYPQPSPGSFERIDRRLTIDGVDAVVRGAVVAAAFFERSGARPMLGRSLVPGEFESSSRQVMLISHELWQTRFGASPTAIGRTVMLDGIATVIVGIMPAGFDIPDRAQFWIPSR